LPLVKSPTMPRKLAANRANGRLSLGHAHLEGEGPRGLITLRGCQEKSKPKWVKLFVINWIDGNGPKQTQ
jgi:hypothetical protein